MPKVFVSYDDVVVYHVVKNYLDPEEEKYLANFFAVFNGSYYIIFDIREANVDGLPAKEFIINEIKAGNITNEKIKGYENFFLDSVYPCM